MVARPRPSAPVVIIGAGMAGLTCAAELITANRPVLVLDASDDGGGRVRTDQHPDGYLLDRGFQVVLDAYPALRRHVPLNTLDLSTFDAGALIWTGRRLVPLADPLRHPAALPRDLATRIISLADKARLAAFAAKCRLATWESAAEAAGAPEDDQSSEAALRDAGLSDQFLERFGRPFWGGIQLDRTLSGSSGLLKFTTKMFLQGSAALPAAGVQAVPENLARRLPVGSIRLNTPVGTIIQEDGRAAGVRINGETITAAAVVVATDPITARRLTGVTTLPQQGLGCLTVYLQGERDPGVGKRLVLDGTGRRLVNHLAPMSAVQPTYAPPGRHLLAAVMISERALAEPDEEWLMKQARDEAALMLGCEPADYTPFVISRIPFSRFARPPGIHGTLPKARTPVAGLYLAGEGTVDSSVNGAMLSGESAARAVIMDPRR